MQVIYSDLPTADVEGIETAIANKAISIRSIVLLLNAHGIEVGVGTVTKHRRRLEGAGCKCPIEMKQ